MQALPNSLIVKSKTLLWHESEEEFSSVGITCGGLLSIYCWHSVVVCFTYSVVYNILASKKKVEAGGNWKTHFFKPKIILVKTILLFMLHCIILLCLNN